MNSLLVEPKLLTSPCNTFLLKVLLYGGRLENPIELTEDAINQLSMLPAVRLQDEKTLPVPLAKRPSSVQHTEPDHSSAMEAVANNGAAAAMRVLQQAEERLKELQVQEARLTVSTCTAVSHLEVSTSQ
jgi:hypothetical protein